MSKNTAYIPASDLTDLEHPRIVWRLALPDYAPAENILVNVDRLNKLAYLGGMESLRIAAYDGDATQVSPEVNSVDQQGAATATMKGSVSKAKTYKADASTFENDSVAVAYDYQWAKGTVALNVPGIDEAVARKSHLRDPKQWSRQLDKALRAGVRESSWESLISKSTNKSQLIQVAGILTVINIMFDGLNSDKLISDDLRIYPRFLAINYIINKIAGNNFSDRKHSLIVGLGLDRYFAVDAATRLFPIIKDRKPTN